jgi:lambda family phage portal protein
MRQQLVGVAVATGVPYEVITGDMRGVNDRTVRVILHEFRRRIQAYQHQIVAHQFCRRVYQAWLERALLSGALPMPADYTAHPRAWSAVKWMPQSWPYLHPVQDVEASKAAVRAGFTSRAAIVAEYGEDTEAIDAEQAADNARADDLGLRYDSDGRTSGVAAKPITDEPAAPDAPAAPPVEGTMS